MKSLSEKAARNLAAIRKTKPLIHNITNYVVMNYTANALLAMGASPVMAHASNEVEEMVSFAGALVLNIGTLTDDWVESMIKAGRKASESKTPIILDPVGSGATSFRTDLITDGKQVIRVSNGHPLMGYITGTGCTATVTIGAFLSVDEDPVSATATALAFFGLTGEVAAKNASAPGSFMIAMLDALYTITPEELLWKCKFEDGT
jgi:hydroxyethylthiazole kinase-like sugar kinase family protein